MLPIPTDDRDMEPFGVDVEGYEASLSARFADLKVFL